MALANAHRFMPYPHWPSDVSSVPSTSTVTTASAVNNGVAIVFVVPKTGNVVGGRFRDGTVAGAGGPLTLRCTLETVTTGAPPAQPSTTLVHANATVDINVASSDDDTIKSFTFPGAVPVTQGAVNAFHVVLTNLNGLTSISFLGSADERSLMLPYSLIDTAGVYSFSNATLPFLLEYDDGSIVPICGVEFFLGVASTLSLNNASSPLLAGNWFSLPWPVTVCGGWVWATATGAWKMRIVDADYHQVNGTGIKASTPLLDPAYRPSVTAGIHPVFFEADATLAAGTRYRQIIEATTATSFTLYYRTVLAAAELAACITGNAFQMTTAAASPTDNTSWTQITTQLAYMGLFISGFDDGSTPAPPATIINGRPVLII